MWRLSVLCILAAIFILSVEGILIHKPGTIFGEHSQNFQFNSAREKNQHETKWVYSKPQPNRSRLRQILMRPFLQQRRVPPSRMRNPYAGLIPQKEFHQTIHAQTSQSVPPPVTVRCCVRHTAGLETQIIDTRAIPSFYPSYHEETGPWESNEASYGSWRSGLGQGNFWSNDFPKTTYNIPFPEYSGLARFEEEPAEDTFLNYDPAVVVPRSKEAEEEIPVHLKMESPEGDEKTKRKSEVVKKITEKLKIKKSKHEAIDEIPEPFRSWILGGEKNSSKARKDSTKVKATTRKRRKKIAVKNTKVEETKSI